MYALPNLVATSCTEVSPWEVVPNVPAVSLSTKDEFTAWGASPSTRHCYYSAAVGQVPTLRISETNQVAALLGVVADYDAKITNDEIKGMVENYPAEWLPTYIHRSFSGGVKLVWLFSKPVLMAGNKFTVSFIKMFAKKLMLRKLLKGLDEGALYAPHTYNEVGRGWTKLSDDPIPYEHLHLWAYEAGNSFKWRNISRALALPLDKVALEVEKRWPGRWKGAFLEGARGVRFWDPSADCPTAAVIRATGVQCFTGDRGFVPWVDILGPAFLEKFDAGRIGAAVDQFWFDGKEYWRKSEVGPWTHHGVEDLKLLLKVEFGISPKPDENGVSELDRVRCEIMKLKTVTAAVPIPHRLEGELVHRNERYLNIKQIRSMPPAEEGSLDWGVDFPWIGEFLFDFFVEHIQRDVFLAWWRRFWLGGLRLSPEPGQAVCIVGEVQTGKTVLTNLLVSASVGGSRDASDFLMGSDTYNRGVLSVPLMTVDDEAPTASKSGQVKYSANVKKMAANTDQTVREKWMLNAETVWCGRVMITCNLDYHSRRLLPSVEQSTKDKLIFLRCSKTPRNFPETREKLIQTVTQELPYFLRWLNHWTPPAEVLSPKDRFGVVSYKDPMILAFATEETEGSAFLELLKMFLTQAKRDLDALGQTQETVWAGNANRLVLDLRADPLLCGIARDYRPVRVGQLLSDLRSRGYDITQERSAGECVWVIPYNLAEGVKEQTITNAVAKLSKTLRTTEKKEKKDASSFNRGPRPDVCVADPPVEENLAQGT